MTSPRTSGSADKYASLAEVTSDRDEVRRVRARRRPCGGANAVGGARQRVEIGRALWTNPSAMILRDDLTVLTRQASTAVRSAAQA